MPFIQLQFRRDLASNWTSNNPTLAPGELGIETDTNLFKIGTGVSWVGTTYGGLQGLPGATGDTGTNGVTGTILFAGSWDINATYNQNDLVSDNGSMYYWLSSTSGNSGSSPSNDPVNWGSIALPGPTGATGETGPSGTFSFSGPTGTVLFYDGSAVTGTNLTYSDFIQGVTSIYLSGGSYGNGIIFDNNTGFMQIGNLVDAGGYTGTSVQVYGQNILELVSSDLLQLRGVTFRCRINNNYGITGQYLSSDGDGNVAWKEVFSGPTGAVLFYDGSALTGTNLTYSDLYQGDKAIYLSGGTYGNGIIIEDVNGDMLIGDMLNNGNTGTTVALLGQYDLQLLGLNELSLTAGSTFKCQIGGNYGIIGEYLASDGMQGVTWKQIFSGLTGTVLFYDGSAVTGTNLKYEELYQGFTGVYLSGGTYGNGIVFDYDNGKMIIGDIGVGATGNTVTVSGQNELALSSPTRLSLSGSLLFCSINGDSGVSGQYLASDGNEGVTWKEIVSGSGGTFSFSGPTGAVLFYDGSAVTGTNLIYSDLFQGVTAIYLSGGTYGNGIVIEDIDGHMYIGDMLNPGNTGNKLQLYGQNLIEITAPNTLSLSGSTFKCQIGGSYGITGQYLASDGDGNVTWKKVPGLGNVLIVDQVYGNDSTASIGGLPYQTVEAAIQGISGTTGTTVWVMPGTYNVAGTIYVPNETALRGLNTQTCIIQNLEPADNEILLGMGENCRVEDLTFKLTSAEHHALTGIRFQGTTTQTSKLRNSVICVDNSAASSGGSSNVYGILCQGTGTFSESTFSFNCIKGSTINVKSNGAGRKRGIYVSQENQVSVRDTNIYVATPGNTGSTGTYVGVETNDSNQLGSIQIRSSSIGAPKQLNPPTFTSSDILQTQPSVITNPAYLASPGIQIGPGVDLLTKSAGGRPFSTYSYPTTLYYGLRGLIKDGAAAGVTGYLWPGTQAVSASFPDITTPAAYYRVQQPVILSGINIHSNTSTSANGGATFFVFKTSGAGMTLLSDFTAGFTASQTDFSYYNSSHDFASGDLIHVGVVQTGGGNNNTMGDITIQLDMF
jgi:hypothetical protein